MLLQALCSISYPLVNSDWSYSLETPNLGQITRFLAPCDLEIWRMALKNNREPLLSNIKLYVSFRHHMWIQTGVTVRKRLSWVVTSVTLTFDLWLWPWKNRAPLLCYFKLSAAFHRDWWILELQSGNAQSGSNSTIFRAVWPWNLTDDLEKQ